MPSFQVTTPNARVNLRSDGVCEVPYSVTNVSGGARRGIFSVAATDDKTSAWYSIKGAPAFDFAPSATQQVTVLVAPLKTASAQDYSFHLVAAVSDNPNADFTDGPVVTYTVTPAPPPRAFPWWIVIVALVLIAIVGAVAFFIWPRPKTVPRVVQVTVKVARDRLTAAGLKSQTSCIPPFSASDGTLVVNTDPAPGQPLPADLTIKLIVANCIWLSPPVQPVNPRADQIIRERADRIPLLTQPIPTP